MNICREMETRSIASCLECWSNCPVEDAIARLIHGFRSFRDTYFTGDAELFEQLKHGQNPRILVIACPIHG